MKIFKFGGASVKNAQSVTNLFNIVNDYNERIIIVISAMGKMTNAFESVVNNYFYKNSDLLNNLIEIKEFHFKILNKLFNNKDEKIFADVENLFTKLSEILNKPPTSNYDFEYDRIVSFGELLSTLIVSYYLNYKKLKNTWVDLRKSLKTNDTYREAKVNWKKTSELMNCVFTFKNTNLYITQGFIGSDNNNFTTTLGREGSDFTASIIAYSLNATEVTVWKDVAGIYNADPRIAADVQLLNKISYQEAIELSFYGAKIIHQKTIKPLQNKNIPLYVKSFVEPSNLGTVISNFKQNIEPKVPVFIEKENQILITISPKDFSFVRENSINQIFTYIVKYRLKLNLMQNSALNFSIAVDNDSKKVKLFINALRKDFKVLYNDNLVLKTIRHYNKVAIQEIRERYNIYLEQKTRSTAQFLANN